MKQFITGIAMFLLCGLFVHAQDPSDFNPNNPPEPSAVYILTLNSDSLQAGSATGGGNYHAGDRPLLKAIPMDHYVFVAWMEGASVISQEASFYYTMPERNVQLTAHFEYRQMYLLNLYADPEGLGELTGGGFHEINKYVSLSAPLLYNYLFKGWWEENVLVNELNSFQYLMPERTVQLTARYEYNPSNPVEPNPQGGKHRLYLMVEPIGGGSLNPASGVQIREQESTYLYAYANTGFKFDGWYHKDTLFTLNAYPYYTMGTADDTLTARFHYDPNNPGEPNPGTNALYYLSALTQTGAAGNSLAFPVYLCNENLEVYSAVFEMTFPAGVKVDYHNVALSSRSNGHTLTSDSLGNNQFRFTISNQQSLALVGTSGKLLTIPVILPTDWVAGSNYPVQIGSAQIGTASGQISCPAKSGIIGVTAVVSNLYASFYADIHLNRVLFTNMSSKETKTSFWDFGDGQNSTETNPLHEYSASGSYDVKLIVSDGIGKDSALIKINIVNESNWTLADFYTLNKHLNNVKNFTSGLDLFRTFSNCNISKNIIIEVEAGETFDIPLNTTTDSIFRKLTLKIGSGGSPALTFLSSDKDSIPLLNFSGPLNRSYVETVMTTARNFRFENVETAFSGLKLNITKLNELSNITICSGHATPEIDLAVIGDQYTLDWGLINTPLHLYGQVASGKALIPVMVLVNDTTFTDTLIYRIQFISDSYVFYAREIRYAVLASVYVIPATLAPASNSVQESPTVTFKWKYQENLLYDLYMWEKGTPTPVKPLISDLWVNTYTDSKNCIYGRAYKWKILAKSSCDSVWSPVDSFQIGRLPDLKVESIVLSQSEIYAGDEMDVHARIINIGGKVHGNTWSDQLYLVYGDNQQYRLPLTTASKWRVLEPDSSYEVDFHAVFPLDTIPYAHLMVVADNALNLTEISELNNLLLSDPLNLKHYIIDDSEFKTLKLLNDRTSGANWVNRWNFSTKKIQSNFWPGVGFQRGRVVSIELNNNNLNGQLPAELFNLPYLRTLSLYNNKLNGRLENLADSIKTRNYRCDSLNHLNLGYNLLSGEIATFANRFPNLKWLDLESNRFSEIDTLLSKNISTLNIQNQVFSHSGIPLSMNPALEIPSLFWYRHDTQELLRKDLFFYLMKNNSYLGWINFKNSKYVLNLYNDWMYSSTDSVDLVQSNSYLYGSRAKLRLSYSMGDANIDQLTDIRDIQQTLNRILQDYSYPFNRIAADTYSDDKITVQDIVSTVNMLLESGVVVDNTQEAGMNAVFSGNFLFISNGNLMLDVQEPVSALDLSLKNVRDKQLGMLLNSNDFQTVSRNTPDGVRFIIYSGSGKEIPAGLTTLAQLSADQAKIVRASLANKQAEDVSVQIAGSPTGWTDVSQKNMEVYLNDHHVTILLYQPFEQVTAYVSNIQGQLVNQQEINQLAIGRHTFEYSNTLPTGVYLLKLVFRNGESVQIKNYKWIVSK